MRRKWILTAALSLALTLLSGCFSWSPEDCYDVPKPPEDFQNLMDSVAQTKRELAAEYSATVEDVPPSAGSNTSTVQQLDLDGDGEMDTAVTFFRVVGAEHPIRIYFYTLQEDESYQVSHIVSGDGASVYAIHYVDLDGQTDSQGKKRQEIVVSWQMSADVYSLGVYALSGLEATPLLITGYQGYQLLDLNQDGLSEVAVAHLDLEQQSNTVEVYSWNSKGLETVTQAPLSGGVTAVRRMKANYLAGMTPALYIAGDTADGVRTTDIVALRDGALVNLSLNQETWVSREQVTVYRDLATSDVNGDMILELAHPWELPAYGDNSAAWLIDWTQYDIQGEQEEMCTTYHNSADGWYLMIPEGWRERLTIYRNDSVSGQRTVVFALWMGEDREPAPFLSIYKLTGANRSSRAVLAGRFILAEDASAGAIYSAAFFDGWDCGLDQAGLLENFQLIISSWTGD